MRPLVGARLAHGWRTAGVWQACGRRMAGVWLAYGWRVAGVWLACGRRMTSLMQFDNFWGTPPYILRSSTAKSSCQGGTPPYIVQPNPLIKVVHLRTLFACSLYSTLVVVFTFLILMKISSYYLFLLTS